MEKSGADIRLGINATPKTVASYSPDAAVIAVGSHYAQPPIEGIEKAMLPDEALMHPYRTGDNVVVIGGGLIGSETALSLAEAGKNVTIVEMLCDICTQDEPLSQVAMKTRLAQLHVAVLTSCRVTKIAEGKVSFEKQDGGQAALACDTVISAAGCRRTIRPCLRAWGSKRFISEIAQARARFTTAFTKHGRRCSVYRYLKISFCAVLTNARKHRIIHSRRNAVYG